MAGAPMDPEPNSLDRIPGLTELRGTFESLWAMRNDLKQECNLPESFCDGHSTPGWKPVRWAKASAKRVKHATTDRLQSRKVDRTIAHDATQSAYAGAGFADTVASGGAANNWLNMAAGASTIASGLAGFSALAVFASSCITDRDQAHSKLAHYVYSAIDDEPPLCNVFAAEVEEKHLHDAARYAFSLLIQSKSQLSHMHGRLNVAKDRFLEFMGCDLEQALSHHKSFVEVPRVWKQAAERGGAVFEFMRRLTHVGSYIQAVLVVERLLIPYDACS
jgi:hypothetical protein